MEKQGWDNDGIYDWVIKKAGGVVPTSNYNCAAPAQQPPLAQTRQNVFEPTPQARQPQRNVFVEEKKDNGRPGQQITMGNTANGFNGYSDRKQLDMGKASQNVLGMTTQNVYKQNGPPVGDGVRQALNMGYQAPRITTQNIRVRYLTN